jgi:RNA polymerase sigma factor (sigma-70 family)
LSRFRTTRWSLVQDAGGASPHSSRALDELCRLYRPPVLAYVRGRGHGEAEAQDLTQAFFEQVLRLRTHAAADPQRGRFRVFLLVALKRFLSNQLAAAHAEKRGGGIAPLSLDDDVAVADAPADPDTPEGAFERAWANTVLRVALARLQSEAEAAGKAELFRALRMFLLEAPEPAQYAQVAERLGLRRNTLAVAIHRMRQRLHDLVCDELAETVSEAHELEHELGTLQSALSGKV